MSSITADSSLLYEALVFPHHDRTLIVALVASLFLHAAAITLLPGMRTPQLSPKVITVELERTPPPEVPKKIQQKKPVPRQPEPKVEKSFERQELQATPTPTVVPQPARVDPRTDVTVAARPEPMIERKQQIAEPAPVMRAEPRPLPEVQPMPQPRVDRAQVVPEPQRPEPVVERRVEVRPEPRLETRVEPRLQAFEPRVAPRPEQRVEPVATPRVEPVLQPQRQQLTAAPAPSRLDAVPTPKMDTPPALARVERQPEPVATPRAELVVQPQRQQLTAAPAAPRLDAVPTPKMDAPPALARVERQPEVKVEPRNEPAVPARQRPVAEPARPTEQAAPRPEGLAERKPAPMAAPQPDVRPAAPPQPAQLPRPQPRQELSRNDLAPVVVAPQAVQQPTGERRMEPPVAARTQHAPEVRPQTRREPVIEARAPNAVQSTPSVVAPPEQARAQTPPRISAPTNAAVMPAAPKRNKPDEATAIQRFAAEISRQLGRGVSEHDYPRLARDRRWQGTTQLVLHIHPDGKVEKITVATSSGYEILDERAIELIRRLKLPVVPAEIQSPTFTVRIPVQFALKE